jgi:hypothetical protein
VGGFYGDYSNHAGGMATKPYRAKKYHVLNDDGDGTRCGLVVERQRLRVASPEDAKELYPYDLCKTCFGAKAAKIEPIDEGSLPELWQKLYKQAGGLPARLSIEETLTQLSYEAVLDFREVRGNEAIDRSDNGYMYDHIHGIYLAGKVKEKIVSSHNEYGTLTIDEGAEFAIVTSPKQFKDGVITKFGCHFVHYTAIDGYSKKQFFQNYCVAYGGGGNLYEKNPVLLMGTAINRFIELALYDMYHRGRLTWGNGLPLNVTYARPERKKV